MLGTWAKSLVSPELFIFHNIPYANPGYGVGRVLAPVFIALELQTIDVLDIKDTHLLPDEGYLWVTYARLASVWSVSLYAAHLLLVLSALSGNQEGPTDIGRYLGRCP